MQFDALPRPDVGFRRVVTCIEDLNPPAGDCLVAFQEVDQLYGELTDAGAPGHKPPWDAFWGQRYAQVRDPDGNLIDLFALLA